MRMIGSSSRRAAMMASYERRARLTVGSPRRNAGRVVAIEAVSVFCMYAQERKTMTIVWKLAGACALGLALCAMLPPATADDTKTPTVKQIMTKLNKPKGLQ